MTIRHDEDGRHFDLFSDDGIHLGEIDYMRGGNNDIYATHTEVFVGHEGQGYATLLLEALVNYAERTSCKIVPICGFVAGEFRKDPEKFSKVMK